jgi:hypothetical protein
VVRGTLLMPPAKLRLAIGAGACDVAEMARIIARIRLLRAELFARATRGASRFRA